MFSNEIVECACSYYHQPNLCIMYMTHCYIIYLSVLNFLETIHFTSNCTIQASLYVKLLIYHNYLVPSYHNYLVTITK